MGDPQSRPLLRNSVEMADDEGGYGSCTSFSCVVNFCENASNRFALDLVYR